jgi:hypothetical protein
MRIAFVWISCALFATFAVRGPTLALEGSKSFAAAANGLVVKTEGRKGTRLYRPDDTEDYDALTEAQEKGAATATHEQTPEERLEECMRSWDDKTHITKSSRRLICQRQIKDDE